MAFLLEALRENPFSCFLYLLESTCIPWFMIPDPHLQSQNLSDPSSIIISFSDQSQERFTTFKNLYNNIGPTLLIQVNFSISKFLTLITSGKSLCLLSLHIHRLQQIGMWPSLGAHLLPTTPYNVSFLRVKEYSTSYFFFTLSNSDYSKVGIYHYKFITVFISLPSFISLSSLLFPPFYKL